MISDSINSVKIPKGCIGLTVNPEKNIIYLLFPESILCMDGSTNEIKSTIDVEHPIEVSNNCINPTSNICVNPSSDRLYLMAGKAKNRGIWIIDTKTNKHVDTIHLESRYVRFAINPNTNLIYICKDKLVSVIDGSTNMEISKIRMDKDHSNIVIDINSNTIYIINRYSNSVSIVDGLTNKIVRIMEIEGPDQVFVNHNMNLIYVIRSISGGVEGVGWTAVNLDVITHKTSHIISTKKLDQYDEVIINPNMNRIYIRKDHSLLKLDAFAKETLETIKFPQPESFWKRISCGPPNTMTLNPVTNKIYLKDNTFDLLHVVDG